MVALVCLALFFLFTFCALRGFVCSYPPPCSMSACPEDDILGCPSGRSRNDNRLWSLPFILSVTVSSTPAI